jgi:aryl-alcohol dehydrogenase-like predicted oxidoreductase
MRTRSLGATGLVVTRLGLGMAALGRPGYVNLGHAADLGHEYDPEQMRAHAWEVLDAAWAQGVRYFDAARSYGDGERFLAGWLAARGVTPEQAVVSSKWGYTYVAGWQVRADKHEVKEHSLPVLRRQAEESRSLLGAHLRLYQIHSATLDSGVLDNAEVLAELSHLRQERGWKIGLSLSGPNQADALRKAMTLRVDGVRLFDTVQATWNLLERSAGAALEEAHEAGMGVVVKEALANGRLTVRNDEPEFAAKKQALAEAAARFGVGIDAVALAAVLARPWADAVLSGASTVDQVNENAKALSVRWDEEAEARLAGLTEGADDYWKRRTGLEWN